MSLRLRYLLVALVIVVAIGAIVEVVYPLWLTLQARTQFEAEVAAYHRHGEPVLASDFARPTIPDAQNAAYYLRQAAADQSLGEDEKKLIYDLPRDGPFDQAQMDALARIAAVTRPLRKLVHRAAGCSAVGWGTAFLQNPLNPNAGQSHLTSCREIATLLGAVAVWEHQASDAAAAIGTIGDILAVGRASDQDSLMTGHLTALGTVAIAAQACRRVASDLRVGTGRGHPVPRSQVEDMIAKFLDDSNVHPAVIASWRHQRAWEVETMLTVGKGVPFFRRYIFLPRGSRVYGERRGGHASVRGSELAGGAVDPVARVQCRKGQWQTPDCERHEVNCGQRRSR